jgi:hypothetical protein
MKNNNTVLRSRYGNTDVSEEFLRYPFEAPIKYDVDYTGTYSKFSIIDKYYVDTLVKPHKRLISGGVEWSNFGNSMTFSTSDIYYTFTGEILSMSASEPNLPFDNGGVGPRVDAVVINEGGTLGIVKGDVNTPTSKPTIAESQVLVQYAYINTSATTLGESEQIYTNNAQWGVTNYQLSGLNSGTFNAAYGLDDFQSGFCVQLDTDYRTGVKFTKPSGGLTASNYGSLSMRVKFTSIVPNNKSLFAQMQGVANGANVYGNTLNLMAYGLQRDIVNIWQHVVVPTTKFGSEIGQYNALTLRMSGGESGVNTLWRVDQIIIQRGWNFDGYMGEPDGTGGVGGSSTAVSGGVIGPAEDGTYTDGVFTDFNPTTPIGTAVDRFNELFLALVPAPAPALANWSGSRSGGFAGNGKLSFGTTNQTIDGTTYFAANAANGASPVVAADGTWTVSGKRLTIHPASGSDITGTLAFDIGAESLGAYAATSFREATLGNLTLSVNGIIVSTQSLSSTSALNNTSGNSVSGFSLSAATQSKFQNGKPFETDNPLFTSRSNSTWLVKANDPRLRNGYNYIIAEHKSTTVNTFTRTLARFDFIQDANTFGTTFSEFSITSFTLSGTKFLSGIEYFMGGTINYDGTMSNLYRNTYNPDADAVSFNDASLAGNGALLPIVNLSSVGNKPILNCGDDETKVVRLSSDYGTLGASLAFTLLTSSKRRLNDPIGISTTAKRTLQGTRTGGTSSISNVYLDNFANDSTLLNETFNSETYRLKGETVGLSYSVVADVTSNAWVSAQSLKIGDNNHNTGLMVYNGKLMYPTQATPIANFSTPGSLVTNLNFGNSDRDYSALTGNRTYIRYFRQVTPARSNYAMVITGTGTTTFVAEGTALSGNNAYVHLKLPTGSGGAGTGWLDCYTAFSQAAATNNNYSSGGVYLNGTRAIGQNWNLTVGNGRTSFNSDGYVVIRITVSSSWTGSIDNISLAWF